MKEKIPALYPPGQKNLLQPYFIRKKAAAVIGLYDCIGELDELFYRGGVRDFWIVSLRKNQEDFIILFYFKNFQKSSWFYQFTCDLLPTC